jgi:hypothetical protein
MSKQPHQGLKGNLNESASIGIWYLYPGLDAKGGVVWKCFPRPFNKFGESNHPQLWEKVVAPMLTTLWQAKFSQYSKATIMDAIASHVYAFPRGRIVQTGTKYKIYWGEDISAEFGISKTSIERLFSIEGKAEWIEDEHEHCLEDDRDELCRFMRITPFWPAV